MSCSVNGQHNGWITAPQRGDGHDNGRQDKSKALKWRLRDPLTWIDRLKGSSDRHAPHAPIGFVAGVLVVAAGGCSVRVLSSKVGPELSCLLVRRLGLAREVDLALIADLVTLGFYAPACSLEGVLPADDT